MFKSKTRNRSFSQPQRTMMESCNNAGQPKRRAPRRQSAMPKGEAQVDWEDCGTLRFDMPECNATGPNGWLKIENRV